MRNKSVKRRIAYIVIAVMALVGGGVSILIILHEGRAIVERYHRECDEASAILAKMVRRDVTLGNYFAVRNQMAEYAKHRRVSVMALCLENGEKIVIPQDIAGAGRYCGDRTWSHIDDQYVTTTSIQFSGAAFGSLVVAYPMSEAMAQVARMQRALMVVSVFIVLVAIVLLLVSIHFSVSPIVKCIEWMKDISLSEASIVEPREGGFLQTSEEADLREAFATVLKKYRSMLEEKRRQSLLVTVGTISSQIAHDMRSPLSVLRTYVENSEMMQGRADDALYEGALRSLGKLNRMANDLVDYAKATKVSPADHKIQSIICGEVLEETKSVAEAKGALIHCAFDAEIRAHVDAYRLSRVIVNLVNNAVQAVPVGDGDVEIRATSMDDGMLVITVKDNGRGIDSETLPHVFESFFTKGKRGGTGLGLAYCKQVVEAHGGTIDVESEVGKGSTFTIRIPDCVVNEAQVKAQIEVEPQPAFSRVLIADDDPDMRLQWKWLIKKHGGSVAYESATIMGVEEGAIDYAAVDTAIVDFRFEGEDKTGIDLIAHLKEKGVKRVFLCTGFHDDPDVQRQAEAAGAEGVIAKPLDDGYISAVLTNSLSSERAVC